jgi:hypothetical protein
MHFNTTFYEYVGEISRNILRTIFDDTANAVTEFIWRPCSYLQSLNNYVNFYKILVTVMNIYKEQIWRSHIWGFHSNEIQVVTLWVVTPCSGVGSNITARRHNPEHQDAKQYKGMSTN